MDHIDIISAIGEHCDDKTMFNLCCTHMEYCKTQREKLRSLEMECFHKNMKKLVYYFPSEDSSVLCRIKYMHKVFRYCVRYNHVVEPKVRSVLLEKLKETKDAGMSKRKYKYYSRILANYENDEPFDASSIKSLKLN